MIGPLSYVDVALLAVMGLSGILAMYRGLTRELLSIVSWVVAAAVGYYVWTSHKQTALDLAAQMNLQGLPEQIPPIVLATVVALIVLIVVHLITMRISDAMLDSQVGMIDRILGLVFGILRGFILVVIPYTFYLNFFPKEETHPAWVRDSISKPYLHSTGRGIEQALRNMMPEIPGTDADAAGGEKKL